MSPIRTRAQNRRKSGVSPPASPLAPTKNALPHMAPATRSPNIKKTARRRKSFKIEVLADLTSSLNVAEQRRPRRKTSFHPESVPLIKATPLDEVKKASPTQATRKRRLRMATYRASLHVHWAENLRRVAPTSSSSSASDPQRGQGEQAGGQPRSILRVSRDDWPVAPPASNITPAGTLRSSSNVLGRAPLYVLPEVPRGITLRRPWRESRVSPHPRASGSQTLSVEDSPSDPISDESFAAGPGQASCETIGVPVKSIGTDRNNPTLILPSRPTATRTTDATSSATQERATVNKPTAAVKCSGSIRLNQVKARRLTTPADTRAPAPALLPAEIPVVPQHRWLNLPENRVDRWIMIFYMIYAPIILPLVLRVLGMV
ncbi:hypothetical protein V8D89_013554 [Ganoderma adspersum]